MQLLQKLRKKPFCNDTHFFVIGVIILALTFKKIYLAILLLLYLLFLFKKTNLVLPMAIILIPIALKLLIYPRLELSTNNVKIVYIYDKDDDKLYGRTELKRILIKSKNNDINIGDVISVSLQEIPIEEPSYEGDFDYKEYLLGKKIIGTYNLKEYNKVRHIFNLNIIKRSLLAFYKNKLSPSSFSYVSTITFGDNELDSNIKDAYSIIGISHVLAISGVHIIMLYKLLCLLMTKVFKKYNKTIPLLILFIYLTLIGFPISALRAYLFLLLGYFNEKGEIAYTKLDILSIAFLIMVLYNPFFIYQTSFILSFMVSFLLLFVNEIIDTKGLVGRYKLYYLISAVTLPFVSRISGRINVISFILSPIMAEVLTKIVLPISYICCLIPFSDFILKYIYLAIDRVILFLSGINFYLSVPYLSIIFTLIYYILISIALISYKKKNKIILASGLFLVYLISILSFNYLNPITKITFIDVGQGDSCLIQLGNNKGNILIDAYNSIDYLKKAGIKRIDYLILTHSDDDHVADAKKIVSDFKVKNVLLSYFDDGYEVTGRRVKANDSFKISGSTFSILAPYQKYDDKNSNSVVVKANIEGYTFMFTGDMSIKEEEDILNYYNKNLTCDVLKVGHHGSKTSSSKEFINKVNPTYSIVSVKNNNKYNLPDIEVVELLNQYSKPYYTKTCGNITFKIINGRLNISTYRNS